MSYSEAEYKTYFDAFVRRQPLKWARYASPEQEFLLMSQLVASNLLPSETTVEIVINKMAKQGWLLRTDNGESEKQYLRETIAKIEAQPITKDELDNVAGLSQVELADRYWFANGVNEFRYRYDLICRTWGFQVPPKPKAEVTGE